MPRVARIIAAREVCVHSLADREAGLSESRDKVDKSEAIVM